MMKQFLQTTIIKIAFEFSNFCRGLTFSHVWEKKFPRVGKYFLTRGKITFLLFFHNILNLRLL